MAEHTKRDLNTYSEGGIVKVLQWDVIEVRHHTKQRNH